ncbi:STAS domain-containing protein [Streptosporangium sp. NPDC023615]|uniref:STAS domain-containing protein n=1 Tax=Streptosporangium sp. NPDC023615 TaxID=3154794 RepID=UPI0034218A16
MGPFHLAVRPVHDYPGDHTVVEVGGEVDLATASRLHAYLVPLIDGATGPLVLDLGAVTFMDARGLTALVAIRTRADAAMIPFRLAALPPLVRRLLCLTRLEASFTVVAGPDHRPTMPYAPMA